MKPLLSERQEVFARGVASGLDPVLAFRRAGYSGGPAKADRLLTLPRIQSRLVDLADDPLSQEASDISSPQPATSDPYETIFHAALAEKKYGDALRAQQAREAKSKGIEADHHPIDLQRLNEAQRKALRGHIEAAFTLLGLRPEDI